MRNYNRQASITTMLQHLHLPKLQQCHHHSKIIMLYIITHQLAIIPTATYITASTRNTQHYILPYARTQVFKTYFFPSTMKIWNNLQRVITNSTTIPQLGQALQSTPTSDRRGAIRSAYKCRLGGHLTLTSIIQQPYTNTSKSSRHGGNAVSLGCVYTSRLLILASYNNHTPTSGRRGATLSVGGHLTLTTIIQQPTHQNP